MRHLYLVRHAKSSWNDSRLPDKERPLNKRGLKNAPEMGLRLAEKNRSVDLLISSPANRALTTASFLASALTYPEASIQINDDLYFNGLSSQLNLIRNTDSSTWNLMLVGHNPDMTSLFNNLCGYQVGNMPTCAIASIQFEGEWSDIISGCGSVVDYDYPKKI